MDPSPHSPQSLQQKKEVLLWADARDEEQLDFAAPAAREGPWRNRGGRGNRGERRRKAGDDVHPGAIAEPGTHEPLLRRGRRPPQDAAIEAGEPRETQVELLAQRTDGERTPAELAFGRDDDAASPE